MELKDFESYQAKLKECDKVFFDSYTIENVDAFFQEMHDNLVQDEDYREEFADSLITYQSEHWDFGNEVNRRIAEWLIYQDREYYEYGDSELSNADELAGALHSAEYDSTSQWMKNGSYWCVIAECLGYDFGDSGAGCMEFYLADSRLDSPYPDYTTAETKLILSEMCYDYICGELEDDSMDIEKALKILSESDIRLAKIKSFDAALNKKAPIIYERLCKNTAIGLYYCYHNLGNEKKALKELKKANVSREEKTIVAFSNCCCKGFESENPFFSELEDEQLVPKKGRGKGSNKKKRKKSLVSMIKKLLRFLK